MKKLISFKTIQGIKAGFPSSTDVQNQRIQYGRNEILEVIENPWWELLKATLKDPMIWFLVVSSGIFFLVQEPREGVILLIAIIPLLFMDAYLHRRTQSSTAGLKSLIAPKALVIRDGGTFLIDAVEIVPGDLVKLTTQDLIPADGVFEKVEDLLVDESTLTGESLPVSKKIFSSHPFSFYEEDSAYLTEDNLGHAGTRVLRGKGLLRIIKTGKHTTYGEIIQSTQKVTEERTELQHSVTTLVKVLSLIAGSICLVLFFVRIFQGKGIVDAFLSSATVAISALPEEFPVVFSFFLGVGVYRLAKKNALVRRAVSVENIGRVSMICSDKTGTITVGQLRLTHLQPAQGINENELLTASLAASNPEGMDPVDQAIFEVTEKEKISNPLRLKVLPFTENRKSESAIIKSKEEFICATKGAPEVILSLSSLSSDEKAFWEKKTIDWAREGHKVLGVCSKKLNPTEALSLSIPNEGYQFLGLMAFEDPPRPEVRKAIEYCHENQIKVMMITGDHPETARAIALEVGIGDSHPRVISAQEEVKAFSDLLQGKGEYPLDKVDVISRCTPLQKLEVVKQLKKLNHVVAVTGDGVNDVPAIKAADIGISMGGRGTKSAREVSSIVLLDDNFSTIVEGIKEGKQLFYNLKLSFDYLLLFHIPFVLSAALIPFLGLPVLYRPVHIVWLESLIHPTALFAFQMEKLPSRRIRGIFHEEKKGKLFFKDSLWRSIFIGLFFAVTILFFYLIDSSKNGELIYGRTRVMALLSTWNATIVLMLTGLKTRVSKMTVFFTLILSLCFIQFSPLARELHLAPLTILDWGMVLGVNLFFLFLFYFLKNKLMFSSK